MKIGIVAMLAAIAAGTLAGTLAIGTGPAAAADQLRVAMNADPDVLDMTQSTNPPQGLATMDNVYELARQSEPQGRPDPRGCRVPGTFRTAARSLFSISATASRSIRAIR